MVNINAVPCSTCRYYNGVRQPDKTEKTEYIACDKASAGRAENLLRIEGRKIECDKWKEDD